MKIVDIRATTVAMPLEAPLRHAIGAHWGRFIRTIVEVVLDNGVVGLGELGGEAAIVIHGAGGADELNLAGPTRASALRDGTVTTYIIDPIELGLSAAPISDLAGGAPSDNADLMRHVLGGNSTAALRDAVLLNAAAALSAKTGDLASGLAEARESLGSGAALKKMEGLVDFSRSVSA